MRKCPRCGGKPGDVSCSHYPLADQGVKDAAFVLRVVAKVHQSTARKWARALRKAGLLK